MRYIANFNHCDYLVVQVEPLDKSYDLSRSHLGRHLIKRHKQVKLEFEEVFGQLDQKQED